jgi:hypothetical protein
MNDFFAQLILRLFSKTPLFFTVIKYVAVLTTAITGLPDLIEWLSNNEIHLPEAWVMVSNKVVAVSAIVGGFVAQLTLPTDIKVEKHLK